MTNDPIVEEVRNIRKKMLAEHGGDIDKLIDYLKEKEMTEKERVISIDEFKNVPSLI